MKTRVLLPFLGLLLIGMLFVGGAICGSFSADDDWTMTQADR